MAGGHERKGGGNRKNRERKPHEERENRAKTKTEMGLVTATVVAAGLTLTRGPSTATHGRQGRSTGRKGRAGNLGWEKLGQVLDVNGLGGHWTAKPHLAPLARPDHTRDGRERGDSRHMHSLTEQSTGLGVQ